MEIIKLVFGILLSLGTIVLFFLSFKLFYKYLIQEKRCTSRVTGVVKKYTLFRRGGERSGSFLPIVYYVVNNKEYKVVGPEYKAYVEKTVISPRSKNKAEFTEDNQVLKSNISINSAGGSHINPIRQNYPINSEIDVYYDPNNPKLAYVLRYCNKKWMFWLMFFSGIFILIMDIAILLM